MKGPTISDLSHSSNSNVVGNIPSQRMDQNQTGGVSPQRLINYNHNNSGSRSPYRDFGSRMIGYANVQPVQEQPPAEDPFAEYAWMAEEDEFDRQVLEQMEQEAFFEACVRQICEEEEEEEWPNTPHDQCRYQTENNLNQLTISEPPSNSVLNPNAVEFIPRWLGRRQ